MTSPIDLLLDRATMRCLACGRTGGCDCWVRCSCGCSYLRGEGCTYVDRCEVARARREKALAYIGKVAETCGCSLPGHAQSDCGCAGCNCHVDENEAVARFSNPKRTLADLLAERRRPVRVRDIAATLGIAPEKQKLSALSLEMRRLGWRRGAQIASSKGSSWWWPPG